MQKKLKTLGLVLLAFTLTTAVGVSVNTEIASAKKVTAKTLKLKKKKLSIKTGEKKTLKVTVKPKNATLKWKSNKKKIATVTKKGVVKGKKKGTAKITVTSGKKKATCKVTVKQTFNLKSVEVVNSKVVRVTLNKAKKLTAANFAVAKKTSSDAKSTKKLTVASVNNSKNKVYDLILATNYDAEYDDNSIASQDYVSVTIKKLNGVKTKEAVYYASAIPTNEYIGGKTGNVINENVYYNASYKGYLSSVKVSGLPAGLKAEVHNQFVTIKGIPTAVANGTQATMTAKDESGKSLTQKILFYIGSDSQIVSYIPTEYRTILANDESTEYYTIHAYGGSGSYNYQLEGNTNTYISNEGDDIYFDSYKINAGQKVYLPVGKYTVAYSVTDRNNASIKTNGSLAVTAVNGVKISGTVLAGDNTPVAGAEITADFKDVNHTFKRSSIYAYTVSEDYTDSYTNQKRTKGSYEMVVYPSQAYSIEADKGGAKRGVVNYNPGTANQTMNFTLPIYKITFTAGSVDVKGMYFDIEGVDGDGYKSNGSDYTYLKKGSYSVNETTTISTGTGFDQVSTSYKLTSSFTVNGNMSVNLAVTPVGSGQLKYAVTPITIDTAASVTTYNGASYDEYQYYSFTPAETGKYVFQATDAYSQTVRICSDPYNYTSYSMDSDNNYTTEGIELTAGTKYVFRFSNSGTVKISKYVASEEGNTPATDE